MTPPVSYILVALTLMSSVISLTFLLAWRTLGKKPYTLNWSVAFLATTFQWAFSISAGWFPGFESYWLAVNALGIAAITLNLRGHCQRTKCSVLPGNLWPAAGAVYLVIVWTTVVDPHTGISTSVVPAAAALTLFLSATMILRHREKPRPAELATATTMIVFGLAQLSAAVVAIMQGPTGDEAMRGLYMSINFISLPVGYAGLAILVLFMVASDLSEDMKQLAVSDQLTGLLNRRGFSEKAAKSYALARASGEPVSVVMSDIDLFKKINDDFGHHIGDLALCRFAELLYVGRRDDDIVARMGGEEFALVLPGIELREAMRIADELCERIDTTPIEIDGEILEMTASFGVATISRKDTCLTDIIVRADRALYRSKKEGRNRVDLESSQLMLALDGTLEQFTG